MARRAFPLLLAFLVLFGMADDLLASFTPDPQDDLLAAADNTYLTTRAVHDQLRGRGGLLPSHDGRPAPAAALTRPAEVPADLRTVPPAGVDPLYRLKSLQR